MGQQDPSLHELNRFVLSEGLTGRSRQRSQPQEGACAQWVQPEPWLLLCGCWCSPAAGGMGAAATGVWQSHNNELSCGEFDCSSPRCLKPSLFIERLACRTGQTGVSWLMSVSCDTGSFPGSFPRVLHALTELLLPHPLAASPWGWLLHPAGHQRAKDCGQSPCWLCVSASGSPAAPRPVHCLSLCSLCQLRGEFVSPTLCCSSQ